MVSAMPVVHERAALYAVMDRFMEALVARDPGRVRWADGLCVTENNVALMMGDGVWGTATARGDYDLRFADPQTGQVGLFTTITETVEESAFTVRLGVDPSGAITQVETLVVRQSDEALVFANPRFERKPVLEAIVPEAERMSRERLRAVADGYFNTLEQNDGQLFTRFHPECNRVENGVQTTNNPDFMLPIAGLPCEEQFRLGWYRYDDRLRGRRFPLVDVERGLVLAYGFIDHCGRLADYTLTNGEHVSSLIRRPHTFYLAELFKIENGALRQIEANFITVPYHMPSPWDRP
ncbi:hypothetical protein SLG_27940 [Sphingobium sp. SYK-6]|uniref:hypothetical protein n=1 Tax=Sphingobium sp. (strain NBRC 103272 / SYK-6) TaxID=627192 RepID=UPI000227703A|nr:hypothetical protein [Sphingobium sp. SYK-6]BAK67469.1 hypothetical protein SLG_27940 [Sphingobium sp. SYK-6]